MHHYLLQNLGGLEPDSPASPVAVSMVGADRRIVGADWAPYDMPVVWDPQLEKISLPHGFKGGMLVSINSHGDAAGGMNEGDPVTPTAAHAIVRRHDGTVLDLHEQMAPAVNSFARQVNNHRDVVAVSIEKGAKHSSAWFFKNGASPVNLTTTVNKEIVEASSINDSRQIVGALASSDHPYLYDATTDKFSILPVHLQMDLRSIAINSAGQIAGLSPTGGFIIQPGGTVITFKAHRFTGINDLGQVLFRTEDDVFIIDPLAPSSGTMPAVYSLNDWLVTPDWIVVDPNGLDNTGAVTAMAVHGDENLQRGVLLVPGRSIGGSPANPLAFARILFGIINDGPGLEYPGGKQPFPGPPPDPPIGQTLSPGQRDALLGLAINASAGLISGGDARTKIQALSAQVVSEAARQLTPAMPVPTEPTAAVLSRRAALIKTARSVSRPGKLRP
jgi:hypothetical protein